VDEEELDPIENFFGELIAFVEWYTNFKSYKKMDEEKKKKYVEKLTLLIVFETSPRKHFDIGMDTIRLVVRDILDKKVEGMTDDE
jgi:hypothetical protein